MLNQAKLLLPGNKEGLVIATVDGAISVLEIQGEKFKKNEYI